MLGTIRMLGKLNTILLFAAAVTVGLFYTMQLLVMTEDFIPLKNLAPKIQDITMPELDLVVNRPTPRPKEIEAPPIIPDDNIIDLFDKGPQIMPWQGLPKDLPVELEDSGFLGPIDGNAVPIAQTQPVYPANAASRGIEGFVIVEFDVSETGSVINPRVLAADPLRIFDRAALRAIERWKYNPKILNGRAVQMKNMRTRFSFNLRE